MYDTANSMIVKIAHVLTTVERGRRGSRAWREREASRYAWVLDCRRQCVGQQKGQAREVAYGQENGKEKSASE